MPTSGKHLVTAEHYITENGKTETHTAIWIEDFDEECEARHGRYDILAYIPLPTPYQPPTGD